MKAKNEVILENAPGRFDWQPNAETKDATPICKDKKLSTFISKC